MVLDVFPSTNIVRNIGMKSDATITKNYDKRMEFQRTIWTFL